MTDISRSDVIGAIFTLLRELTDGAAADEAWVLNREDPGLLRSLDRISAAAASAVPPGGGSSIAAHVDHLRYGLELLNRWSRGEDPFADADYGASWRRLTVTDEEWTALRRQLRSEVSQWTDAVKDSRRLGEAELNAILSSVVHLAYHVGAIRQIDRSTRGPTAND
jgi:DinB superfamily